MNNNNKSRKITEKTAQTTKSTTRTQQLQKPWLLTVNKMSHMLCHSGGPGDGDIELVAV